MAIDTAMVTEAQREGVELLRLYRWLGHTVSFGANESAARHWDRERLDVDGVQTVRRPTGGRAVWHDAADLTYAWTGPAQGPAEVRRIYRDLHERLAAALAVGGGTVALATTSAVPGLAPGACFDIPVGGEVLRDGRKVVGSAQRVFGQRLLQHGAIAVADRQELLARYGRGSLRNAMTSPGGLLEDAETTAHRIVTTWQAAGAREAEPAFTSRILLASVEHRAQYLDPAWTWRR
jgi:lipoate-protein ligase A